MSVPFLSTPDKPLTGSTQNQVPIADITHNIILFKDGSACLVLESTSLNFDLLSELEQEAVIAAYAALLNSLTFPIQIVVKSERKDISNYLRYLEEAEKRITNSQLAGLMSGYKKFIEESIRKKNVLSKKFYIIIPFSALELGVTKSFLATTKRQGPLPFTKSYVLNKATITLNPKRDHLTRQANRIGIQFRQLTTDELINLSHHYYNLTPPPTRPEFQQMQKFQKSLAKKK